MIRRKKLLKWFGMFFAAMFVFTLLSRAADSVNVAGVTVKTIQNQIITHKITGSGKVEGVRETAVFVQEGQRVAQVLVQEGQKVEEGSTLLRLSGETLDESIRQKKAEEEECKRKIQDLETAGAKKAEEKKNALERAQEDYATVVENGEINIANARMEADVSRQKLQNYFDAVNRGMKSDSSQEQALRDEIRAREEALNQVIMTTNQTVLEAERAVEDAKREEASDGSLENAKQELDEIKKSLDKLEMLSKADGEIKAPSDGVVKSIAAVTGSGTTREAALVLYDTKGEMRMTGIIGKEDLKYAGIGGKVSMKGSSGTTVEDGVIEAIREQEGDPQSRTISVSVPGNTLAVGETVEFTISSESGPYNCCVPLSALYEENGQAFVYIMDTENTILGEVTVARKVDVTVKEKNETLAALADGSLSSGQKVIAESDRLIEDGSRVRLPAS